MDVSVGEVLFTVVLCMCLRQVLVCVRIPLCSRIVKRRLDTLYQAMKYMKTHNDPNWQRVNALIEKEFGTEATMKEVISSRIDGMVADITKWTYDGFYNKK